MIFIDAREGLSGDMVLASMIGLLDKPLLNDVSNRIGRVASENGLDFHLVEILDRGESGLGVTCIEKVAASTQTSHSDAFSRLDNMGDHLGSKDKTSLRILELIFEAEGEAHGLPPQEVHLHEIGRPQALLNIAGIGLVHSLLVEAGCGEFVSSTITTGKGIVVIGHGAVRVPAPATRLLLRGLEHLQGDDPGERATPTGIAAVKALISSQTDEFPEEFVKKSIGFGTRRFGGRLGRTTLLWTGVNRIQ